MRLRIEPLEDRITPVAGALDPTFGTGGIAPSGDGAVPGRVALLPDGRFYATSYSLTATVGRFLPDGSPDGTFGNGGFAQLPGSPPLSAAAALPDGGVAVGGIAGTLVPAAEQFAVTRLTSTGTIDANFGTGGTAVVGTIGVLRDLNALVAQTDGRILVVGERETVTTVEMEIDRLTTNGQLDPAFGQGGTTIVSSPAGLNSNASAVAAFVQADGRIMVAGRASGNPAAARLTPEGRLDPTFGAGGLSRVSGVQGDASVFSAVNVLADGRILLAGQWVAGENFYGLATRMTADGRIDSTFGSGGLATTAPFTIVPTVAAYTLTAAPDSAGRAVFAITQYSPRGAGLTGDTFVARLTDSGTTDAGFGSGGQLNVSNLAGVPQGVYLNRGLTTRPNGDILLGGEGSFVQLIGSNPPTGFTPPGATGTVAASGTTDGVFLPLTFSGGAYQLPNGIHAFPAGSTVRATTADVTGDGTPDYIVGPGPGAKPQITVFDGSTGRVVADFLAFEPSFTGGVFVAAADLDGDSKAEVVVSPDQGGGPRVVVYSIAIGGFATQRASFFGFDDANFRGGARVALGDVDHDGTPDLAVAAGFLGGPRVALIDGGSVLSGTPVKLVSDFYAFPGSDAVTLRNGTFVAIGDLNGDGFGDLIFGGGPGGSPRVFILDGQTVAAGNVAAAQAEPLANFFVNGNSLNRGGVRVAAVNADGDSKTELVVGSGEGTAANVRVYLGKNFTSSSEPSVFQDLAVFGGAVLSGGVYVG